MKKTNLTLKKLGLLDIMLLFVNYIYHQIKRIPIPIQKSILKYGALTLLLYLFVFKDANFHFSIGAEAEKPVTNEVKAVQTSNNLFLNPNKAFAGGNKKESKRVVQCQAYVDRFYKVAIAEQKKYGIPASITLAQGLLESNIGKSKLAVNNNNHFGLKCFSKACKKGHCTNYNDDHHKDFFRNFKTAWESYRSHSILLSGKRYKHLKKLSPKDYKGWAKGLQKAGYATDKKYAQKLIRLIETVGLTKYD